MAGFRSRSEQTVSSLLLVRKNFNGRLFCRSLMAKLLGSNWLTGLVVWWPFAIVDIPNGWAHCDGVNGRPDYRNYILIGAGDLYTPGQVLGSLVHFHEGTTTDEPVFITGETDDETICLDYDVDIDYAYEDPYYSQYGQGHRHPISLTGDVHNHGVDIAEQELLPPCKAGCWVIKL